MNRVLIIGIDGLDSILISRFEAELPNFRKLKKKSPITKVKSVYPHDSFTAWASIYTGLNPAKTGVVYFENPLAAKDNITFSEEAEDIIHDRLQGMCFWDYLSSQDKKVCIVFPHAAYPPWPVNGIMVSRSTRAVEEKLPPDVYPPSISKEYDLSQLNTIETFLPKRTSSIYRLIDTCKSLLFGEFAFGLNLLKRGNWDLFFVYSSVLDYVQHMFWNYCDENDPTHIDGNPFKSVIKDFYVLCDSKVGELISAVDSETTVIVLSDHGHGMRPVQLLNINEILRKEGYLASKISDASYKNPYYVMEKLKGKLSSIVSKYGLVMMIAKQFLHVFPSSRKMYTSPFAVDWQETTACVSDPSGIKAYSYGGIVINRDRLQDLSYEEVRSLLIDKLSKIREPSTGENLVKWICRREDLYQGDYINKYPDIIFELKDGYGVGWSIHDSVIGASQTHDIQPGGHMADSAVFLISNLSDEKVVTRHNITLMDVAPTVLELLGTEVGDFNFDGTSIFKQNVTGERFWL